jgi:hypothetical protein
LQANTIRRRGPAISLGDDGVEVHFDVAVTAFHIAGNRGRHIGVNDEPFGLLCVVLELRALLGARRSV